jgi:hypothetical protein
MVGLGSMAKHYPVCPVCHNIDHTGEPRWVGPKLIHFTDCNGRTVIREPGEHAFIVDDPLTEPQILDWITHVS